MKKNFQPHKRTRQSTAQQTIKGWRSHLTGGTETINKDETRRAPEQSTTTTNEVNK